MLTGCGPDVHGIVGNAWFDRKSGAGDQLLRRHAVRPRPAPAGGPAERRAQGRVEGEGDPGQAHDRAGQARHDGGEEGPGDPGADARPDVRRGAEVRLPQGAGIRPVVQGPLGDPARRQEGRTAVTGSTAGRAVRHLDVLPRRASTRGSRSSTRPSRADRWLGKTWTRLRPDLDYAKLERPGRRRRRGQRRPARGARSRTRPSRRTRSARPASTTTRCTPRRSATNCSSNWPKAASTAEKLGRRRRARPAVASASRRTTRSATPGGRTRRRCSTSRSGPTAIDGRAARTSSTRRSARASTSWCMTADHGVCPLPEVAASAGRRPAESAEDGAGRRRGPPAGRLR